MAEYKINVIGETCPVPLVETRKALRLASSGDTVEVTGNHPSSKREIPMAAEAMGLSITEITEEGGIWTIKIKK